MTSTATGMNIGAIQEFEEATVAFDAVRVQSTQLVWHDEETLAGATGESWSPERFLDKFSFVTPDTPIFANLPLDRSRARAFLAERYGGSGLSDNGGGSRTGTCGQFQIKGMGVNPVLGRGSDAFHSYGGLDFRESVAELINSIVLGRILPHGTVPFYGLIYTGRDAAYSYPPLPDGSFGRCPSALLVRAASLRPAHFLRNVLFDPALRAGVSGDVHRVRCVNKALNGKFAQRQEFIKALGRFLGVCAQQFGFASVFRIRHGALTASNIAFDGRWLDIAFAAFIDSGKSYATIPSAVPSQEEPLAVLTILQEFIYTFEKYNRTFFDSRPLAKYYVEQLGASAMHYCARLVGLPPGAFDLARNDGLGASVDQLAVACAQTIAGDRTLCNGGPMEFNDQDPIVLLIEDLFAHLPSGMSRATTGAHTKGCEIAPAFLEVATHSHERRSGPSVGRKSFLMGCAIRSLRKLYFSSFYYFGNMYAVSSEVAALENPADGGNLIDEVCDVSRWLFDDEDRGEDILFKSRRLTISYNGGDDVFLLRRDTSGETHRCKRAGDLVDALNDIEDRDLHIRSFDFRKNLLRMLRVIQKLDGEEAPRP